MIRRIISWIMKEQRILLKKPNILGWEPAIAGIRHITQDIPTWCRLGKMSGSIRHLSAIAADAAARPYRLPEGLRPCSRWRPPIIFQKFQMRSASIVANAPKSVPSWQLPWKRGSLRRLIRKSVWAAAYVPETALQRR